MGMESIQNMARREATRSQRAFADSRMAIVTSYNPKTFMAKVKLQPWGIITDWIPISTPGVGDGFGVYAAPNIGDQVYVLFLQNDWRSPVIIGKINDNAHPPPQVPAGEVWIMKGNAPNGPWLKLKGNDVELQATDLVKIGDLQDTLYRLCTDVFETWVKGHTHFQSGTSGPVTGGPSDSPPANSLTDIVLGN